MALEYKRVRIKRFAQLEERETPESRFWRKFKQPTIVKQPAAVTCIDFCEQAPHDFVATTGTRLVVYDGASGKEKRVIAKFKETVFSGTWRRDGQMLVCGNAKGAVQALQPTSRAVLRTFRGHTAPVHTTRFTHDGTRIVSGSDDASVRVWDMSSSTCVGAVEAAHADYVRCSALGPAGTALAGVWATGSYDHTVKLWDSRTLGGGGAADASAGEYDGEADRVEDGEEEQEEEGDGEQEEEAGGEDEAFDADGSSSEGDDYEEEEEVKEEEEADGGAAGDAEREHYGRGAGAGGKGATGSTSRKRPRDGSILSVNHGEPVTSVTLLPGGGALATTGSNTVKIWDVLGGGRLIHTVSSHAKLITATCLDGSGVRLLSAGLDGLVKVHDLATFRAVHTLRYAAPLLCLGIGKDNVRLVVGSADGGLHVRTRAMALGEALREKKESAVLRGGTYRYFLRGATGATAGEAGQGTAAGDDIAVLHERKPKLRAYDTLLKGFQHSAALDAALDTGEPVTVASVLEELSGRHALGQALAGRSGPAAARIVGWAAEYVGHPRYAALCADVATAAADAYSSELGSSPDLDSAFVRLAGRVRGEARLQAGLLGLQGCLDMLMAAASTGMGSVALG